MIISEYEVYKINFQTPLDESAKSPNISNLTTIQSNYGHIWQTLDQIVHETRFIIEMNYHSYTWGFFFRRSK